MDSYVNPITETPTAKILLQGLMLMCFNSINRTRQCEIAFLKCPGHDPTIEIKVIHDSGPPIVVKNNISDDLYISAIGSTVGEIIPLNSNQDWAFDRHHADIEGKFLHGRKVDVNTSPLFTRLRINAGHLYTHKHVENGLPHCVHKWMEPHDPGKHDKDFGKLAKVSGVNIQCPVMPRFGISIFERTSGLETFLPSRSGTRYQITIDNNCISRSTRPEISDFRLYYTSGVVSVDGYKYDFARRYSHERPVDRSPDVCVVGFLGLTSTLGLPVMTSEELHRNAESISSDRELKTTRR